MICVNIINLRIDSILEGDDHHQILDHLNFIYIRIVIEDINYFLQ